MGGSPGRWKKATAGQTGLSCSRPFSAARAPWPAPERGPAPPGGPRRPSGKPLKKHVKSCIFQLGARGDSRERGCGPGRGLERRGAVGKHERSEKTSKLPYFTWFRSYEINGTAHSKKISTLLLKFVNTLQLLHLPLNVATHSKKTPTLLKPK